MEENYTSNDIKKIIAEKDEVIYSLQQQIQYYKDKFYNRDSTCKICKGSGKIVGHGLDGYSTIDDCNCKK